MNLQPIAIAATDWLDALIHTNQSRSDAVVMNYPIPQRPHAVATVRLMADGPRPLPRYYASDSVEDALADAARNATCNMQQPMQQKAAEQRNGYHRREAKEYA